MSREYYFINGYFILFSSYFQCKEQSEAMLEKACIMVENTAKGGGVYPEVLFQVAKYWYELYLRVSFWKCKLINLNTI